MNSFHWFLQSLMLYSFVSTIHSAQEYPLTFNPYTLEIYNLKETKDTENPFVDDNRLCAIACPAQQDSEKNFAKNISMHYKTLFLQQITTIKHHQLTTNPIKCETKFQLSLLLHSRKDGDFAEFGYEVYFEKLKFTDKEIKTVNRSEFFDITTQGIMFKRTSRWMTDHSLALKKDERKLELLNWSMLWVPQIEALYKVASWSFTSMRYVVRPITNSELLMECRNYDLDDTVFHTDDGKPFDDYYKYAQKDVFKLVEKPQGYCNSGYDHCVRKYELLMPYHYLAHDPDSIACSNLTSIPIWDDIPEELTTRIKIFLIAVAQVAGRELIVIPGTLDVLALPRVAPKTGHKKIYLSPGDKKLPVPNIIYKLIRYRSHSCEEKIDLCWFNVVIVIQNNPDVNQPRLCLKDKCQEWGWDYVQLADINDRKIVSPFVYCCRLTKDIATLLNFHVGRTNHEDLNLNHFPRLKNGEQGEPGELKYHKIQHEFENQYIELRDEMVKNGQKSIK